MKARMRLLVVSMVVAVLVGELAASAAAAPLRYRLRNDGRRLVALRDGHLIDVIGTRDPAPSHDLNAYPFALLGKSDLGGNRIAEAFLGYPLGASSIAIGIYRLHRGVLQRVKAPPQVPYWDGALFHGASFACRRFARGPGLVQRVFSKDGPDGAFWRMRSTRYFYVNGELRPGAVKRWRVYGPEDASDPRLRRFTRNACPGVQESF